MQLFLQTAEERNKVKSAKKFNWWNTEKSKFQYTSVLFVTPTPGGVLAKEIRKREEELNKYNTERIKIEEKGGLKSRTFYHQRIRLKNLNVPRRHAPFAQKVNLLTFRQTKSKFHVIRRMSGTDGAV